jgi:protocatechuate 3,4-dioxygenase beta subunit
LAALNHENSHDHSRDPQDLFDFRWNDDPKFNNNTGCALSGLSTYGPFWHEGQPERADIRAGQRGIYLRLAMQIIDVTRCKPLHGAQVDVWHATSMGDYSSDMGGYLRGWQPSSKQGTVDFDTNFPGHYTDRASHIHVVVRAVHEKRSVHYGMIYLDQNIRDEVEKTDQYKDNHQPLLDNIGDLFIPFDSTEDYDPFVRWSRIGNSLEDGGLLAWITLGVNTSDYSVLQPPDQKRDVIDW